MTCMIDLAGASLLRRLALHPDSVHDSLWSGGDAEYRPAALLQTSVSQSISVAHRLVGHKLIIFNYFFQLAELLVLCKASRPLHE